MQSILKFPNFNHQMKHNYYTKNKARDRGCSALKAHVLL